jgi:integration host factor subunit alpha
MPSEAHGLSDMKPRYIGTDASDNPFDAAKCTVTRASLARRVQKALGVSRAQASIYVAEVLTEIFDRIVAGEEVKLSSFGNFTVREKRERAGRNPKTGAPATITARLVVVFRASPLVRARLEAAPIVGDEETPRPLQDRGRARLT